MKAAASGLLALFLLVMLVPMGSGDLDSPTADCDVTMNGHSARDLPGPGSNDTNGTFGLPKEDNLTVEIMTEHPIVQYAFRAQIGPRSIPIFADQPTELSDPTRDAFEISADRYNRFATGIYHITGNIVMEDPEGEQHTCTMSVLVHLGGNPLTTIAGLAAAAIAVGGLAGLIQSAVGTFMDSKEVRDSIKDIRDSYKAIRNMDG